ncbi:hypothetical protein KC318_g5610 [Hortaea werneckii]|nr:hypothetical protein KC334_g5761 [Hortaea werneckii]KAI7011531.1 hypothetical protein KC355_g5744 [Hortaea werneckii]KAI7667850.1 hypothetical protein KC318_g5610 [Hortaea werneckii]
MSAPFAARLGFRAANRAAPSLRNNATRFTQRRAYQAPAENPANVEASPAAKGEPTSAFGRLWNSPVGPKTVHFWAPIMKWGLVLAGAADFARPAEQLSLSQNTALMATGLIWTRWCFVIKPRNLFLASVNFLLFCVGATQSTRVLRYQASLEHNSVEAELKKAGKEEERDLKNVVQNPESVVKSVTDPK